MKRSPGWPESRSGEIDDAGLFALPSTVEAGGKDHRGRGDHARKYKKGYGLDRHHRGYGTVPHRISARDRHLYGHYFSYCGDSLYLRGGVRLPGLALDLAFGGPDRFYLQGVYRSP